MPDFQFDSLGEFLAMGGYGFYVWVVYGVFFVVMGVNLWLPLRDRANLLRLLKARQRRQQQPGLPGELQQQQELQQ